MIRIVLIFILALFMAAEADAQPNMKLALVKYRGGGDWYANPTALPNLAQFCNQNLNTELDPENAVVEVGSAELFNYPFVHITGHGNIIFSDEEAQNLRNYLMGGGFLHIDDNFGLDKFIRPAMQKVFPELEFVELPFSHPIYHQKYSFPNGLPKIHEHEGQAPQGFGLLYKGRLICFYSFESDLGDGWEDQAVHNDPQEKRMEALRMGANILQYAFTQ